MQILRLETASASDLADWKSKALAPADWLATVIGARDGQTVALEFRVGRKGAAMVIECVPVQIVEGAALADACMPLVRDLWERALGHHAEVGVELRVDYRLRLFLQTGVEEDEVVSDWVELKAGEGGALTYDTSDGSSRMEFLLFQMVKQLFQTNIGMARANGDMADRVAKANDSAYDRQVMALNTIEAKMKEGFERDREVAGDVADAAETHEMGKTARHWFSLAHESKLAKEGVETPEIPSDRPTAAAGLWESITVGQMKVLRNELGQDKADMLESLLSKANEMTSEAFDGLMGHLTGDADGGIKLHMLADKVFSTDFVPGPWASFQHGCLRVILSNDGDDDK